jgi:hypothetical protein
VGVVFTGAAITVFQNRVYTTQTTAYRVVEKITPVVKNMQKNLVLMQTYDNVWKLHYLELHYKISPFQEELGKIALDSTAKTKISELYTKTLEAMRKAGLTELAAEVESFGAKTQKSFTHFYKNAINLELYRNEAYTVTNRFKIPRGSVSSRILFTLGAVAAFAFAGYEIYRAGGDEFVMFCPGVTEGLFMQQIAQLRLLADSTEHIRFAVGAVYCKGDYDIISAMHTADERMYKDKQNYYRNCDSTADSQKA